MMSGMLVLASDLEEPVDKAAEAIETLFSVDPDFVTLCKTLYGSDVDPVEVWLDVFSKDNPTGDEMHVPGDLNTRRGRKRAVEAAGIGATVIGAGLGGKELIEQVPKARSAVRDVAGYVTRRPGKLIPYSPGPVTRVTGVSGMLAGDAAATDNQMNRRNKRGVPGVKAARDVSKLRVPGVHEMAEGMVAGMRRLPGMGMLAPKATQAAGAAKPAKAAVDTAGVAKGQELDVVWAGEFSKFDEDKRLVFGWASVVEVNGSPIIDRQGDYIHPDDLENASYEYVIKSRVGGDMHRRSAGDIPMKVSDLVESVVFTPEKLEKMGFAAEVVKSMPIGWWVGFRVHSDHHWDLVKKGARGGFSIHGRGKRIPTSVDSVMGYA